MWTSKPKGKWECDSPKNRCVAHTGFRPGKNVSGGLGWWGQATNSRGNCTNYVAYRLIQNGAPDPGFRGSGGAKNWRQVVIDKLGAKRADGKPAVGAIAWFDFGHVAYVEKVVDGAVYLSDSSWPTKPGVGGSSRRVVRKGDWWWPDAFLHVKDAPTRHNDPRGHLDKVGSPATGKVRVAGWAYDPNAKTKPVAIHAYIGGKAGAKGAKRYKLGAAKKKRRDVARAIEGIGAKHGFDAMIPTTATGSQRVCVYAINRGPGSSSLLDCREVEIKAEYEPCSTRPGDGVGTFWPWNQTWHLRNCPSAGPSNYGFHRGKNEDVIPLVGDWDGDGKDSIGLYWPWDQTWHLRDTLETGSTDYGFHRGKNEDVIPLVGDWDGDGKDSIGLYWPWDQTWHLRDTLETGSTDYGFHRGKNEDVIPLVGDWDGDGKDSIGLYWPWDQTWHLRDTLETGSTDYGFHRGKNEDVIPVVGDWDGDGKDSTGVYWPWDGTWHLRNSLSSGPSDYAFKRGRKDKVPVVGDWDGEGKVAPEPPPAEPPPEEAESVVPKSTLWCVVPRVRGNRLRAAVRKLRRRHCAPGKIRRRVVRGRKLIGRVLRQAPRPGAKRRAGASVRLVVGASHVRHR